MLFSSSPGSVLVKAPPGVECLRAGLAGEEPAVVPDVGLQVVQRGEPLPALLHAADELLGGGGVSAAVSGQLVRRHKLPAAVRIVAGMELLVVMLHDVEPEFVAFAVGLAAALLRAAPVLLAALQTDLPDTSIGIN